MDRSRTMGFLSLVYLTQALERLGASPIRVDVVANGLHDVVGDEALIPAKTCMLGACRVIPQEHPQITCRVIDVEQRGPSGVISSAGLAALVTELTNANSDPVVAHRRGRRWLQTVDTVQLGPSSPSQRRTRPDGVYLITGGFGRIGMVHAEHITRTGASSIILTGRSPLPDESDWERVLAQPGHPSAGRIRALNRLRALGADVSYFSVDAADREAMISVVTVVQNRSGPIKGIIHAAGAPFPYASVMETDASVTDVQLRGKALGAAVLADLIREGIIDPRELDFCMLVSSISAIIGGAGRAAYAAANCYLDALAADENRRGLVPWISVNWDAWRFGDAEVNAGILPARGERMLARILARAPRQVAVCDDDLAKRYQLWVRKSDSTDPDSLTAPIDVAPTPLARHHPPRLDNGYQAARGPQERALVEIWEDLLGVGPIGVFDDFFELGGHSLLAIQLVSRLRQEIGSECRVEQVFDAPTIAELAGLVFSDATDDFQLSAQQILAAVEQMTEDEAREMLSKRAPAPTAGGAGGDIDD
jgi:NAD(P)-dependent dehydrogenase (short-subunit alcohol dehydrogenase family)